MLYTNGASVSLFNQSRKSLDVQFPTIDAGDRARATAVHGDTLIQQAVRKGVSKDLYLDFLTQAYHHVKYTAPLLASAAGRCSVDDYVYQATLFEYIEEERGHELWVLEDINALGGDAEEVRKSAPRLPCKLMVGHAYYLIDRVSPYAMLGMIHVLEGMAVALASKAVSAIRSSIASTTDEGFKYLTTHSDLDIGSRGIFRGPHR